MEQWLWKIAQIAVFGGLTVFLFEIVGEREFSLAAAMVLALALTVAIFMPLIYLKYGLERRRLLKDLRRGHSPHNRRSLLR